MIKTYNTVNGYTFAGVLPYTFNKKGELTFLLGREGYVEGWSDSYLFSEFGGRAEHGENPLITSSREGFEESLGFFGTQEELLSKLDYSIEVIDGSVKGYIFPLYIEYDPSLPKKYLDVYSYIVKALECSPNAVKRAKDKGYMEKVELKYFTVDQLIHNSNILRPGFRKSLLLIIRSFIRDLL